MITVAETGPFQKKINHLLSPEEKTALISYVAEHPNSGVIIQGSGGIRKLRWARQGGGKSSGIRVIYYFHNDLMPLYVLAVFEKMKKRIFQRKKNNSWHKRLKNLFTIGSNEMNSAFTEIAAGLEDAQAHARGETSCVLEHSTERLNVQAIREKTGMSQQRFCATLGISLSTLKHWEKGLRSPRGAARVLLRIVEQNPQAVIETIEKHY